MKKVLIVDDSLTFREYLKSVVDADEELKVVGTARDGLEAVRLVEMEHPDIVSMDMHMPRMNGFEATQKIMEVHPVPIVIISSSFVPAQVENTFRAIKAGAVAVVEKPKGPGSPEAKAAISKIIKTLKLMSEVKVVKRFSPEKQVPSRQEIRNKMACGAKPCDIKAVAIGASTGGPAVIRTILSNLDNGFDVPILVVQHIAPGFLNGMVEWLGKETMLPIRIPLHGESIARKQVYFAPDGFHMGVNEKKEIVLGRESPVNGLKPSVSYLFDSVANVFGRKAIGVLLTGMGRDGATELKMMKDKGGVTIVQDKDSSVVHGMPGEAIKLDGASYVLSPDEISSFLNSLVCKG